MIQVHASSFRFTFFRCFCSHKTLPKYRISSLQIMRSALTLVYVLLADWNCSIGVLWIHSVYVLAWIPCLFVFFAFSITGQLFGSCIGRLHSNIDNRISGNAIKPLSIFLLTSFHQAKSWASFILLFSIGPFFTAYSLKKRVRVPGNLFTLNWLEDCSRFVNWLKRNSIVFYKEARNIAR